MFYDRIIIKRSLDFQYRYDTRKKVNPSSTLYTKLVHAALSANSSVATGFKKRRLPRWNANQNPVIRMDALGLTNDFYQAPFDAHNGAFVLNLENTVYHKSKQGRISEVYTASNDDELYAIQFGRKHDRCDPSSLMMLASSSSEWKLAQANLETEQLIKIGKLRLLSDDQRCYMCWQNTTIGYVGDRHRLTHIDRRTDGQTYAAPLDFQVGDLGISVQTQGADKHYLAVGLSTTRSQRYDVAIFDDRNMSEFVCRIKFHGTGSKPLAWNGDKLATGGGSTDGRVAIWDIKRTTSDMTSPLQQIKGASAQICDLVWKDKLYVAEGFGGNGSAVSVLQLSSTRLRRIATYPRSSNGERNMRTLAVRVDEKLDGNVNILETNGLLSLFKKPQRVKSAETRKKPTKLQASVIR